MLEVLYYLFIYLFICLFIASECARSKYYFIEQTFGARVTIHMLKMKIQASLEKCEKQLVRAPCTSYLSYADIDVAKPVTPVWVSLFVRSDGSSNVIRSSSFKKMTNNINNFDCSQSPIFPWDFRDMYASIKLPPSWFYGEGNLRTVSKLLPHSTYPY